MGRPQQRAEELKKAAKTCQCLNSFINVSNAKKRRYSHSEEDQHLGECSDGSATSKTDQKQWSDSEEAIDLLSEIELLPPSHRHQPVP